MRQIEAIRANPSLTGKQIAQILRAQGVRRAASTIRSRRRALLTGERPHRVAPVAQRNDDRDGWPVMVGTHEERDAQFAQMVRRGWAEYIVARASQAMVSGSVARIS